jgi:type IV pilus assembly protein PilW
MAVAAFVMAAALSITLSSRKIYEADQGRTDVNQNLRGALDLVGIDLRQAGERLPADFPALEVVNGADGAPDTMIVRRNLLNSILPVCEQIDAGSTSDDVRVVDSGAFPPQGCDPVPDDNGDGWPDNIEEWRTYRDAHGGSIQAYVYNPVARQGEFFEYDGEGATDDYFNRGDSDGWHYTYTVAEMCRVYLIEERTFRLDQGVLQYVPGNYPANPINLVDNLTDFQINAVFSDGTIQPSLAPADDWRDLRAIEITVSGQVQVRQTTMDRTLSARFFPRNILSL